MRSAYAIVTAAALIVTACGGGAAPPSGTVTITATEMAFGPNAIRLKVGQEVRITLENDGEKDHELMFGKGVMSMGGHPSSYQTWLLEGVELKFERDGKAIDAMEALGGEMEHDAAPGMILVKKAASPVTIIFTVPDKVGEWEMGCFEDDGKHYEDGMKGKVTVER